MGLKQIGQKSSSFWKTTVTLEPAIVVYTFALNLLEGSKITTNLLITKTCELTNFDNVTDYVDCSNLTWVAEQDDVMTKVNDFQVKTKDGGKSCCSHIMNIHTFVSIKCNITH